MGMYITGDTSVAITVLFDVILMIVLQIASFKIMLNDIS